MFVLFYLRGHKVRGWSPADGWGGKATGARGEDGSLPDAARVVKVHKLPPFPRTGCPPAPLTGWLIAHSAGWRHPSSASRLPFPSLPPPPQIASNHARSLPLASLPCFSFVELRSPTSSGTFCCRLTDSELWPEPAGLDHALAAESPQATEWKRGCVCLCPLARDKLGTFSEATTLTLCDAIVLELVRMRNWSRSLNKIKVNLSVRQNSTFLLKLV